MKRLIPVLLALTLAVVGCTPDEPKKGWVTNRGHSDSYTTWITQYNCYRYDPKTGVCTNQQIQQIPVTHPERWWLILKKENGDYDKAYVSSEVWEAQPIHSWYAEPKEQS